MGTLNSTTSFDDPMFQCDPNDALTQETPVSAAMKNQESVPCNLILQKSFAIQDDATRGEPQSDDLDFRLAEELYRMEMLQYSVKGLLNNPDDHTIITNSLTLQNIYFDGDSDRSFSEENIRPRCLEEELHEFATRRVSEFTNKRN